MMEPDLSKMRGWLDEVLASQRPPGETMSALIDKLEAAHPHRDWAKFRTLPYDDLTPLQAWLERPFREEPSADPLRGLWFGLFNPCPDGQTPVADIYVCGSKRFEPDPDDNNWAVGPDWWPESRYAESTVLAEIYRIANLRRASSSDGESDLCFAEYPLCLAYGVLAVRALLSRVRPSLLLGKSRSLGIAVGFDSGDFVLLGELRPEGLGSLGPGTPADEKLATALAGLRSEDPNTVFRSLLGVVHLGDLARETVPDVIRIATTFPAFGRRQMAVNVLGQIAPRDGAAKAAILQALCDENPFVRREALQAMIHVEPITPDDLSRIAALEKDFDETVARWAKTSLRNIGLRSKGRSQQ